MPGQAGRDPFGLYNRPRFGGREYRGLRSQRYTYVRDLPGPWLLFDNQDDPFQMNNRVEDPALGCVRRGLEAQLQAKLQARGDAFLPGREYLRQWGYHVDQTGTVPFEW